MESPGYRALRKGRISLPRQVYHLTVVTKARAPFFADHRAAWSVCRRFEDARLLADASMLAWVLMPDHVHWMVQLGSAKPLHKVVEFSAADANVALDRRGSLWARGFHDRALRQDDDLRTVARYIIANPLRAGLVDRVGDYPYWNTVYL